MTPWDEIVGAAYATPGTGADAVDGVVPQVVVRPGNVEDVRRVVGAAAERGCALIACGLGAHLDRGALPERVDVLIRLDRLAHVVDHQAGDMTVTVEAGCSLAVLAATLADAGQWLPIDPPALAQSTVGGCIAANLSGPLRTSQGTVRDFLLGIRVVDAKGALVSGGGKVVKNVAGYDLPKLHVGALGTLGVIVEATFKVWPRPAAEAAVMIRTLHARAAAEAALAVLDSTAAPLWVEVVGPRVITAAGAECALVIGLAGLAEEIAHGRALVEELARSRGWTAHAVGEGASLRAEIASFPARPAAAVLRAACLPTEVGSVLDQLSALDVPLRYVARPASGLVYIALSQGDALPAVLRTLRPTLEAKGGSLVVERAAPVLKRDVDVWGHVGPSLALMRRVKATFDPERRLAPGRFVGGI